MTNAPDSTVSKKKHRQVVKPYELVFIVAFVIIVIVLLNVLFSKLTLHRDVSNAQKVSDKVISDIQNRNGGDAWGLGTLTFKKTYSSVDLTQMFQHITIATLKPPVLDQKVVVDASNGRTVFFVYKYTALKVPYYIRTSILNKSGSWQLTSISGNADESLLLNNS